MYRPILQIMIAGCLLAPWRLAHSAEASFSTSDYGNGVFVHVEFAQIGDYYSVENGRAEFLKDAGTAQVYRYILYIDRSGKVFYFVHGCNSGTRLIDIVQNKQGVAASFDGASSHFSLSCDSKNKSHPQSVLQISFSFKLNYGAASISLLTNSVLDMQFTGIDGHLENAARELSFNVFDIKLNFDDDFIEKPFGYCTVTSVNSISMSLNENEYFKSGTKTHVRNGSTTSVKRLYNQIQCKYARRFYDL